MTWIVISLAILVIILKIFFPKIKGFSGENRVIKQLEKLPESYKIINDVTLRNDNYSSQIDHIVVSPYGVFVIETKTYTGWIHGNDKSDYWTQTIYKNKTRFRNPVKQNWGHIQSLKEIFKDYENKIYTSLIVFAGDAELKNVNSRTKIIYDFELYETIINYSKNQLLSEDDVENIYNTIIDNAVTDRDSKKKHVKDIKTNIAERKEKEKALVCPRCEGDLIIRSGKYGDFYGCSNFPKCRYNKAIS